MAVSLMFFLILEEMLLTFKHKVFALSYFIFLIYVWYISLLGQPQHILQIELPKQWKCISS